MYLTRSPYFDRVVRMLKIRLQRIGRKNIPVFRVVLTDSKNSTKSGRSLEVLGSFDPVNDVRELKADRVKYWISKGAKTSDTIHNYLVTEKIIEGKKVNSLPRKRPIVKEKPAEAAPAAAASSAVVAKVTAVEAQNESTLETPEAEK